MQSVLYYITINGCYQKIYRHSTKQGKSISTWFDILTTALVMPSTDSFFCPETLFAGAAFHAVQDHQSL